MYIIASNILFVNIYISYFYKNSTVRRCGGTGEAWPCRSEKYICPHPLVNKLSRHILALCGGAAIFHDLLTQGCGLYFFFSPAGAILQTASAGIKSKLLRRKESER